MNDEAPERRPAFVLGQDLAALSVAELREAIASLRREIARIERELESKDSTKAAAESLFRR